MKEFWRHVLLEYDDPTNRLHPHLVHSTSLEGFNLPTEHVQKYYVQVLCKHFRYGCAKGKKILRTGENLAKTLREAFTTNSHNSRRGGGDNIFACIQLRYDMSFRAKKDAKIGANNVSVQM